MPVGPVIIVQRARYAGDRHELGRQRARPGQPRQLDDRAGAAARDPQRRRRATRARSTGPPSAIPGKVGFCFAENDDESPVRPIAVERGIAARRRRGHAVRRGGPAVRRRSAVARARVARPVARRLPAVDEPPEARPRLRRDPRDRARARGGCSPTPGGAARRSCAGISVTPAARPGSELVRGADGIAEGRPRGVRRVAGAAEVPPRRPAARLRRRRRRAVLRDHRRLGQRRRSDRRR